MAQQSGIADLLDLDFGGDSSPATASPVMNAGSKSQGVDDLLGMMDYGVMSSPMSSPGIQSTGSEDKSFPKTMVLDANNAEGMEISCAFARRAGIVYIDYEIKNNGSVELNEFAVQYNVGLVGGEGFEVGSVGVGGVGGCSQAVGRGEGSESEVQVAVRNCVGVYYFSVGVPEGLI